MRLCLSFIVLLIAMLAHAQPSVVSTLCGNGTQAYTGDGGPAINAQVYYPSSTRLDRQGNLYFIQSSDDVVRKISASGVITTVAGTGTDGFSGDGGPGNLAKLNNPTDIALDTAGNLYIADYLNSRIRKVDALTGIITTICGDGQTQNTGDGGLATAASLLQPSSIAIDKTGNIYIGCHNKVRRILPSGVINTVCGNGSTTITGIGGMAGFATITTPSSMCVDTQGNLFLVLNYVEFVLYVIATNNYIYRYAGGDTALSEGAHALNAQINAYDIAIDDAGRIFLAEGTRIRMINTDTIINTIGGTGTQGYSGDGGDALLAKFGSAAGIAVDSCNNVYIADASNARIRKVTYASCNALEVGNVQVTANIISIHPNPATSTLTITSGNKIKSVSITDITGREVLYGTENTIDVSGLVSGVYFVRVWDVNGGSKIEKIIKQ